MPDKEEDMDEKEKNGQEDFVRKNKEFVFDKIEQTKEGILLYVGDQIYCISHGC